MKTVETFLAGALVLIAVYLVLDKSGGTVFKQIAEGTAGVFRVLQGRG